MTALARFVATFGYAGYLPRAPGTWGSAAALVPGMLILFFWGPWVLLAATLGLTAIGVWAFAVLERATGRHDPREGVVDEAAGQWLALVPAGQTLPDVALAFVLFRVLDIVKPWPCNRIDASRILGWSGMLDDVVAGAYACAATFALRRFTDAWFAS
ncbi:MAG: phosphatidylglycerophosphatase A [Alphaproteobacteria bacterium]